MVWIEPITDRTQLDVNAENNKGKLRSDDLNRIENNTRYLALTLYKYGYGYVNGTSDFKTDWTQQDLIWLPNVERLRNNIQKLLEWYYTQNTTLPITLQFPTFTVINDIEKNLKELKEMIARMEKEFVYSGEVYCGE